MPVAKVKNRLAEFFFWYSSFTINFLSYFSVFQDVNVMIFVGFGYLMTFLKKYSFGAVGYNLFIACIVLQWATLIGGYITNLFGGEESPGKIKVNLKS